MTEVCTCMSVAVNNKRYLCTENKIHFKKNHQMGINIHSIVAIYAHFNLVTDFIVFVFVNTALTHVLISYSALHSET